MTETEAKPKAVEMVLVGCNGIVEGDSAGFALTPLGFEPTFVEFVNGKPTKMARHYADYLVSQDPTKFFFIVEEKKDAAEENLTKKKPAKAARK